MSDLFWLVKGCVITGEFQCESFFSNKHYHSQPPMQKIVHTRKNNSTSKKLSRTIGHKLF